MSKQQQRRTGNPLPALLTWLKRFIAAAPAGRRFRCSAWTTQALERRLCMTGNFSCVDSVLSIELGNAGEQLVIRQENDDHVLQLLSGSWQGVDASGITGNATSELRFSQTAALKDIRIRDAATDCQVIFSGDIVQRFLSTLEVELDNNPAPLYVNSLLDFRDSNSFRVHSSGAIIVASTGGLKSADGNIELSSAAGATIASNHGSGVTVSGGFVEVTGVGSITVDGTACELNPSFLNGVSVSGGGRIKGGATGSVRVTGKGADTSGEPSHGVIVTGATSVIESAGGSVSVFGNAGSHLTVQHHMGVLIDGGGRVSSNGAGALVIDGTSGDSPAGFNRGVVISGDVSSVTSVDGNITIQGRSVGTGVGGHNTGILLDAGGSVTCSGKGSISVNGTGGASLGEFNRGVLITGQTSGMATKSGSIQIEGYGGGSEDSFGNTGVMLDASATLRSESGTQLEIKGVGGNSRGDNNRGILLSGIDTVVSSGAGDILLTGYGGGSGASQWNYGISVEAGAVIEGSGTSNVSLHGSGSTNDGLWNRGVAVTSSTSHVTGGHISVTGIARSVNGTVAHAFLLEDGSFLNAIGTTPVVQIIADSVSIRNLSFIDAGSGLCSIEPCTGGLPVGVTADRTSELSRLIVSPEELNRIIADSIVLGIPLAGAVTILQDFTSSRKIRLTLSGSEIQFACHTFDVSGGTVILKGSGSTDVVFLTQSLDLRAADVSASGIRSFCFDAALLTATEPAITSQCWLPVSQASLKLLSSDSLTAGSLYALIGNPGTRVGTARFQNADLNNYIDVSEQSMIQIVDNGGDGNDTGFTFVRGRRPWFSPIDDYTIAEDSVLGSVQIRNIDAGEGFGPVRLSASCSGVALEQMTIDYQASSTSALLRFRPARNSIGESIVTVRAECGGNDGDLNTSQDNVLFERTFRVIVQQIKPRITGPEGTTLEQSPALTWTAVPGALKYEVWINNLSTGEKSVYRASSEGTRHVPVSSLGIGRFEFWVRAWKSPTAALPWSLSCRFQVNTRVELLPLQNRLTNNRPEIGWKALPGAVWYDLWIDDVAGKKSQYVRETRLSGTSWTPSSPLPISRYRIWVRGIDASGTYAAWSQLKDIQIAPSPERVSPLYSTFDTQPDFVWKPLPGAVTYSLMIAESDTGRKIVQQDGITASHWQCSQSLPDGYYRWWVMGCSAGGFRADWTVPCEIYVGGRSRLLTPVGTSTVAQPRFEWQQVDGAASYQLWVNREDVAQARVINVEGIRETSWQGNSSLPAGTYRAWIRAVSTSGKAGPWSRDIVFRIASGEKGESLLPDEELLSTFADVVDQTSRQSRESVQAAANIIFEPPLTPHEYEQFDEQDFDRPVAQLIQDLISEKFLLTDGVRREVHVSHNQALFSHEEI